MAPIIKSNYNRRTCNKNVPPILSLRKLDPFDFLVNEHFPGDPFSSSSAGEKESSVTNLDKSSLNSSDDDSERLFFPKKTVTEVNSQLFAEKAKKIRSKVGKRKSSIYQSKAKKSAILQKYEEVIAECTKSTNSWHNLTPILCSTPLKSQRPASLSINSPFSPIATQSVNYVQFSSCPSSTKHLSHLFSNLTCNEDVQPSIAEQSSISENFYGFPSFSPNLCGKRFANVILRTPLFTTSKAKKQCDRSSFLSIERDMQSPANDKVSPCMLSVAKSCNLEFKSDKCEKSSLKKESVDVTKLNDCSNENSAQEIFEKSSEQDVVIEEFSHVDKEIEEEYNTKLIEQAEPENIDSVTNSPCFEKESIIITCEQESLAEDDEDKSEDVSSALSSDQEAREGISSSDLESNSIDEEKDFVNVEMRRHSYEKVSPRKSYIVGAFSRRRCLSKVSSVLSEGNESIFQTGEKDRSVLNQSNKHYLASDEDSQKSSLMFSDSSTDMSDEERNSVSGRSPPSSPGLSAYSLYENSTPLDPLPENLEENQDCVVQSNIKGRRSSETSNRRRSNRLSKDLSPSRQSPISRPSVMPDLNMVIEESDNEDACIVGEFTELDHFVLPANKKYRRSLSIIRQLSNDERAINQTINKGRGYDQFVEHVIKLQSKGDSIKATPTRAYRKSLSIRRNSLLGQRTPPRGRRASRFSSNQTSPTGIRQHHLRTSSLSSTMICARPEFNVSPFRFPLQPVTPQSLLQNISRFTRVPAISKDTSLQEVETVLKTDEEVLERENFTFKDHVMILCEQKELVGFMDILDVKSLEEASKVGEGVYGEVFMITRSTRKNVLKIIPIEGDILVNGEKQKTFAEMYSELLITKSLDLLRDDKTEFMTVCFAELIASWIVKGKYPEKLIDLWDKYDEKKGSDNDRPTLFEEDQLFLVLELGNAGTDLECYSFSTAKQALSIFKQTVFAIAVAEACFEFEHRDLHWGNVLISRTPERYISFRLDGEEYKVVTNGVKSTIIDFTLSRLTSRDNIPIFNDIGQDPDMFIAAGDYQFDIYRHMKKDVSDRWEQFVPKTNVRWLHYLIDKMIKKVKYQRTSAIVHKDSMRCLQDIESWILNCDNAVAIAMRIAEDYK